MDFAEALDRLNRRQPEHMPKPDLDRISALTALLDHPELTYTSVQVTGTNGKTTTARLIGRLACAHGLSAGVYTSPHLDSVKERIAVCDRPIGEDEFAEEYEHLEPYFAEVDRLGEPVTYFEALTALAFLWFADKPVSLGVFEVGMGGTWDATNLVSGDVAVVCPVALDHAELGSTVRDVATEKAGIIKEGKTAVIREQVPGALRVIEARCAELDATMLLEGRDWALEARTRGVGGQVLTVRGVHATYEGLVLPLFGEHMSRNAAASVVAFEAFTDRPLDRRSLEVALAGASSPGRLEVMSRHPLVVLDGAHNPAAADALAKALPEVFTWDRLHLVVAGFTSHDTPSVIARLAPLTHSGYATAVDSSRARPAEEISEAFASEGVAAQAFPSVAAAVEAAIAEAGAGDLVLVTGSLYTVADARRTLGTP